MNDRPYLSIAIPLYNEETRLPSRLAPYVAYLETHMPSYEIVLVNDGSTDSTLEVITKLAEKNKKIRVIHSAKNRGRGFGMRTGVLACKGEFVLETDADLPVSPDHIIRFVTFLEKHPELDLLFGSRGHAESTFVLNQPWRRVFAGKVFHYIFGFLFDVPFKDVMCGFKVFRNNVSKQIFERVYDDRYLAAGEIIHVARKLNFQMKELPVAWEDNRDSKVKFVRDTFRTFGGLGKMLWNELLGRYGANMTITFKEAAETVKRASGRWSWPAIFTRIRFFTAPYFKLASLVPERGFIIDLGSGYGIFANILGLMAPGRKMLGLDLDKYKSDHAKALSKNVEFRYGDITKISIPPIDCVLLIHVLHHLDSYEQQEVLLRACYAKLKNGGKLVICEIQGTPWWKLVLTKIADTILYPGDPIFYRFPEKMIPLLKSLGGDVTATVMHEGTPFSHITYVVTRP
jgi:dolichyl-phosphate beta-glucosyltransferase